jgi:hypothetical protein
MNLVVCGDSFMSADTHRPGTHFSELLSASGHSVTNLARGGMTNTGIAFQLETASKLQPDAVVFSSTSSDRIDVIIKNRKFNPSKGLKNFVYPYVCDSSTGSQYVGDTNSAVLSDVINAFLFPRPDLPIELHDADRAKLVKQYLALFHDTEFKEISDSWILGYWKYKLKEQQIPFIHLYKGAPIGQHMYDYVKQHPDKKTQSVYHTDNHTQTLMAEEIATELLRLKTL